MSSPVKQQSAGAVQPLQSALKKRVEQDNKTVSRGGDHSDQKSVAGGKTDSPLKQAQFRLDAPDTPAAFKGEKNKD